MYNVPPAIATASMNLPGMGMQRGMSRNPYAFSVSGMRSLMFPPNL